LKLEDGRSCRETERLAQHKLALVEARMADLERLRRTLQALIGRCEAERGRICCPIIESLTAAR
jgi:MerR family mercuric resistance operon transcriptional regulator